MAEQDLTGIMAAAYAAYGEGDADPFFSLIANDAVIRFAAPTEVFPFAARRRGPAGAREAIGQILTAYEWLAFWAHELIAEGDMLVALTGGRIRHRPSGRETEIHLADLIRFDGGKIVEFVEFFDTAGLADWSSGGNLPAGTLIDPGKKAMNDAAGGAARNKVLVSEAFRAYGQKDAGPLMALFADNASYNSVANLDDFRFAGPCHGRDAVLENLGRIAEDYELERYVLRHIVARGDLVATYSDAAFRTRATGKLAEVEKLDFFRLIDGRIVEFNEFFDSYSARLTHSAA